MIGYGNCSKFYSGQSCNSLRSPRLCVIRFRNPQLDVLRRSLSHIRELVAVPHLEENCDCGESALRSSLDDLGAQLDQKLEIGVRFHDKTGTNHHCGTERTRRDLQ